MASRCGWLNIWIFLVVVAEGSTVMLGLYVMSEAEWAGSVCKVTVVMKVGRPSPHSFQLRRKLVIKYFSGQTWKTVGKFPTFYRDKIRSRLLPWKKNCTLAVICDDMIHSLTLIQGNIYIG